MKEFFKNIFNVLGTPFAMKNRRRYVFPVLRVLLGSALLVAGLSKIFPLGGDCYFMPIEHFYSQLKNYHLPVPFIIQQIAAIPLICLEIWIGLSLIVNSNVRIALLSLQVLMIIMIPVTIWGTLAGANDCGCYGNLTKRPPWVATIEDAIMLLMCFYVYPEYKTPKKTKYSLALEILVAIVTFLCGLYASHQLKQML